MILRPEAEAEIHRLFTAEKWKVGTLARQYGVHHRMIERIVGLTTPPPARVSWESPLEVYRPFIVENLQRYPNLRATRIYDMICARGYAGSARNLRRFVKPLRPAQVPRAYLVIETLAGEQAQVDWAHVGKIPVQGGERPLWMFVMVLSHSRALYAELLLDLSAHGLVRSLTRASQYFGGCPRQWLFDNPKIVVLGRVGEEVRFNPVLLEAAVALRVQPRLCKVRTPTDKAKVERAVRYFRDRFLGGRTISSVEQGNVELLAFLANVTGARPHPVQQPRTVAEVFEQERGSLLALPDQLPVGAQVVTTTVDSQAFVRFQTNRYSVPSRHVGKTVTLRVDDTHVHVVDGSERLASHLRSYGKHQRVEATEHRIELLRERRRARPAKGRDRLLLAAPDIEKLLAALLRNGHNVGLATVRLLGVLDLYGEECFQRGLKDLLASGSVDTAALAVRCDAHRRALNAPMNLPVSLPLNVVDRDVIPHDLEIYDDLDSDDE